MPTRTAHNVAAFEPPLARGVQSSVVNVVVVPFRQVLGHPVPIFVDVQDAVDDRNVAAFNFEDHDLARPYRRVVVVQKQNVPPLKRGLHTTTENNHDGRLALCVHFQATPYHQRAEDYHDQVEHLEREVVRIFA